MTDAEIRDNLPERDAEYLLQKLAADAVTVTRVGAEIHVVFKQYEFPAGLYEPARADLLVRLVPPYPNASPDMFWTNPAVRKANGQMPQAAEVMQVPAPDSHHSVYSNVQWQRWSRHPDQGQWRKDVDGLRSYMGSIKMELLKAR